MSIGFDTGFQGYKNFLTNSLALPGQPTVDFSIGFGVVAWICLEAMSTFVSEVQQTQKRQILVPGGKELVCEEDDQDLARLRRASISSRAISMSSSKTPGGQRPWTRASRSRVTGLAMLWPPSS